MGSQRSVPLTAAGARPPMPIGRIQPVPVNTVQYNNGEGPAPYGKIGCRQDVSGLGSLVDLHRLISDVPDSELETVRGFIVRRIDPVERALMDAPLDDEPETDEERAAVAEAQEAYARGDVVADEDLDRELGW